MATIQKEKYNKQEYIRNCVALLLGPGASVAKKKGCSIGNIGITPKQLQGLATMLTVKCITPTIGKKIFNIMVETGEQPYKIAESETLFIIRDLKKIGEWIDDVIIKNPNAVRDYQEAEEKQRKAYTTICWEVIVHSKRALVFTYRDAEHILACVINTIKKNKKLC